MFKKKITYPDGSVSVLVLPDCCRKGSIHPSGCLNLAASKAELLAELEMEGSNVFWASDPKAALLETIHSLFSEEVSVSWTGGSSTGVLVQFEDKAGSPDTIAVPVLEALSVGTDEGESPLTEKGKSVRWSVKKTTKHPINSSTVFIQSLIHTQQCIRYWWK